MLHKCCNIFSWRSESSNLSLACYLDQSEAVERWINTGHTSGSITNSPPLHCGNKKTLIGCHPTNWSSTSYSQFILANVSCRSSDTAVATLPGNNGKKTMKTNVVGPETSRQKNRKFGRFRSREYEEHPIEASKRPLLLNSASKTMKGFVMSLTGQVMESLLGLECSFSTVL